MQARASNRRQQILEVLAGELESNPGSRITTAKLAAAVGVSEAALYRHFPSKAKMFEALIEFAEESVFGLVNRILDEESDVDRQVYQIASMILRFAERNPGITRILVGDVLVGEHERLRRRVEQFFARIETQLSQLLRERAAALDSQKARAEVAVLANLLVAVIGGRLAQYVRTEFRKSPSEDFDDQWQIIMRTA